MRSVQMRQAPAARRARSAPTPRYFFFWAFDFMLGEERKPGRAGASVGLLRMEGGAIWVVGTAGLGASDIPSS